MEAHASTSTVTRHRRQGRAGLAAMRLHRAVLAAVVLAAGGPVSGGAGTVGPSAPELAFVGSGVLRGRVNLRPGLRQSGVGGLTCMGESLNASALTASQVPPALVLLRFHLHCNQRRALAAMRPCERAMRPAPAPQCSVMGRWWASLRRADLLGFLASARLGPCTCVSRPPPVHRRR